jgi:hypothetical protein
MLKNKILESCKDLLDEWLLGFNTTKDFNVSLFSSEKVNLKNAIINSQRVNKELLDKKIPVRIKAGLIGKLSIKVSYWCL